jgi:hypothetical protein
MKNVIEAGPLVAMIAANLDANVKGGGGFSMSANSARIRPGGN